jgi:lactose/L-arabinose transport system substrate-binding protein
MKKLLAFTMAATMALSLCACGGGAASSTTASSATTDNAATDATASAATSTAATGDDSLTVWCWDPAFNIYAMQEAEKVYQQTDPNFKLNIVETPWDDLQTALTTAGQSGDYSTLPDIFLCQDNAFQKNVISYPDMFTDLSSSGVAFDQFSAAKVAYSVVDGKNYGVPFDNGAVIMAMRTDILEQAGYKIDDFTDITWDDFITKGKDVLSKTGVPLLSAQAGSGDLVQMIMKSCGANLFDADGKPTIANNDALKKAMDIQNQLIAAGILTQVTSWDEYIGTLNKGTAAATINGCWILASIQTADDQSGKWDITDMPKLTGVDGATNYSNNGGSSWAVSTNCKNVQLAEDFLSKTFAGSVDLYNTILPSSGAIATYAPAAKAPAYGEAQEYFGGDAIYSKIVDYSSKIPATNTGVYYYEALDAISTALTNVINGSDIDSELATAQQTVEFAMQNG